MKNALILITFAFIIFSCKGHNETTSYVDHIRQIDSIVSANRNIEALTGLLSSYEENNDEIGKMVAMRELGKIYRESSDFQPALDYHKEALTIAKKLKDTSNIIFILNQLGTDYRRLGIMDEAAERHYEALSLCEEYSDLSSPKAIKNKVVSLNGIGNIHLALQNNIAAENILRQALYGEKRLGSHLGQAINYANIGHIKETNGEKDSAWIYYEYSMEQNRLANSRLGISLCYKHFGRLSEQNEDWTDALESYMNSYDLMYDNSDKWHWLESCLSIARVYLAMGQRDKAGTYLNEGLKSASEIRSWEHLAEAYRLKSMFEEKKGDYRAAFESQKQYAIYTDSITNEKNISRLDNIRVNYVTEKGEKEKELINKAYMSEQQKKEIILFSLIFVILVSVSAITALIYALRIKVKAQNIIKKASLARQEFFTNVTHEFRTPLTVILGCVEELKAKNIGWEYEDGFDAISRQSQRLLTLVNQLLDIAKVRSAIGNADWKTGDISVFIRMVMDNIRPHALKKLVELEYISDEKEINMDFVPEFIHKIMTNLIFNAIKFTPRGGSVIIRTAIINNDIRIIVEDTGCGIIQEDLPHIFEPFFQSKTYSDSGTGIGLALTKQMVEAMNGCIKVSSKQGKGSSFCMIIPLKHTEDTFEKWIPDTGKNKIGPEEALPDIDTHVINTDDVISKESEIALVVEDNEDIAHYIGNIIKDKFSVIYARNGKEGLIKAEEYVPDVIITDIMMPEYDGIEMTRDIRKSDLLNHIPIIIITAKSDDAHKLQGLDSGADAYMVKPFSPDELKLRIHKLLEYRNILREKYSQILVEGKESQLEADSPNIENKFLTRLNNLIYANISLSNLNSEMLAEKMCLSKSQLNRKVKFLTGISTATHIKHSRLAHAQILLRDPEKSIGEIVMLCGFESASYFTKLFKEKFGMTPSEYRKENS